MFKVGDWVRIENLDPFNGIFRILSEPIRIEDVDFYDVGFEMKIPIQYLTLWQPKEGEYFWGPREYLVSDGEWGSYHRSRTELYYVYKLFKDGTLSFRSYLDSSVRSMWIEPQDSPSFLSKCEPFIGTLPNVNN